MVDVKDGEIDLAIGVCAKHNSDAKSIKDEDKLLREVKEAVDGIIQCTSGHDCRGIVLTNDWNALLLFYLGPC